MTDDTVTITRSQALKALEHLRISAAAFLEDANTSVAADSWYYLHIGEIDMLRELKLIDAHTQHELDKAWRYAWFPRVEALRNAHAPSGSNLEFLRTATPEQIAAWMCPDGCPNGALRNCYVYEDDCTKCWLAWLHSPMVAPDGAAEGGDRDA